MLGHAAHGESQQKLQSVRHALDATPGRRFKVREGPPLSNGKRLSLLSKRNEVIEVLVQFAYPVNTFPDTFPDTCRPPMNIRLHLISFLSATPRSVKETTVRSKGSCDLI